MSLSADVLAVTLQRVGRNQIEDSRSYFIEDGVRVLQVPSPRTFERRTISATLGNALIVYPRAAVQLARISMQTESRILVIGNTALIPLAWIYTLRRRVPVVVNARERFNGIRTKGSLGTLASRAEPLLTRFLKREDVLVVTVTEGHAKEFRAAGARHVITTRNLPASDFAPQEFPELPAGQRLVIVLIGSLYTGRGIEALVKAIAILKERGTAVTLEITGRGSDEYIASLERLIESEGVNNDVVMLGSCEPEEVAARYARGHMGTALYEGVDKANDSLSNKLFETVCSGRPVLAGNLSENVRVVEQYGVGWTSPVTPEGLAETIERINEDRQLIADIALHCHEVAHTSLNWETECEPLVKAVRDWTSKGRIQTSNT